MTDVAIQQSGAVLTITLDRPASRNGLVPDTAVQLAERFETASTDTSIRVIVLTGAGRSFCSGADLMAAAQQLGKGSLDALIRDTFHRLIRAIIASPQPVVASIRGPAVGYGFDLALACDLRVVSRDSKLGAVFARRGLVPDGGSSFTLSRLVGLARAMELVLLADTFDGQRAYDLGLANRLVDDDALETETAALVARLAEGAPLVFKRAKQNLHLGLSGSLDEALEREVTAQVQCIWSRDAMEGVTAFFQKRKPEFTGS